MTLKEIFRSINNQTDVGILLILIAGLTLHSAYIYAPSDDAYIYLVYVNNLFSGNGLTYNGNLVQGFSSTIWPLLIAGIHLLQIPLTTSMELLSYFSGAFVIVATFYIGKKLGLKSTQAAIPSIGLILTGDFAFYSGNGLETILFSGLVLMVVFYLFHQKPEQILSNNRRALLLFFTLVLVRPEGLLISAIVIGWLTYISRSPFYGLKFLLKLSILIFPILITLKITYGNWLPATYYAKSGAGIENIGQGFIYFILFFKHYLPVLLIAFFVFVFRKRNLGDAYIPLMILFVAWIGQVTTQGGDNMVGFRMYLAIIPTLYLAITYGLRNDKNALHIFSIVAFACIFISYNFGTVTASAWQVPVKQHAENWRAAFIERKNLGLWLKNNLPSQSTVALSAAGITPYYSELPTIDMLGLNNNHIALFGHRNRSLPYAHQAGDGAYILHNTPDVIVLGGGLIPGPYVSDQEIWASRDFHNTYIPCEATRSTWIWIKKTTVQKLHEKGVEVHCQHQ